MAALWAAVSTGDLDRLLDTPVSRRGLWTAAALASVVSGGVYVALTWSPSSAAASSKSSPLTGSVTRGLLKDIAERAERANRVLKEASRLAIADGAERAAVASAAAIEMRDALGRAEAAALKAAGVPATHLHAAWRFFSSTYEASLEDESDDDDDDDEADAPAADGPSVRAVTREGWRIKRAATALVMDADVALDIARTLGRACEREVPPAFLALQEELDELDVSAMPPAQRQQVVMGRVQAIQPAIMGRADARIREEFGVGRQDLTVALTRLQASHPGIDKQAGEALRGFQQALQGELKALVATLGQ